MSFLILLRRRPLPMAAAALLSLLGGCTAAQPPAQPARPAVLASPTPQCHAEIEQALGIMLKAPVSVSRDAFTTEPELLLERPQPRDAAGLPRDGRLLGKPVRVTLATDGRHCILGTDRAAEQATLRACDCRAQATP